MLAIRALPLGLLPLVLWYASGVQYDPTDWPDTIGAADGTLAGPNIAFARGTIINRYVILERLGAGGMGVVFSAYDPELRRRVTLKFLLTHEVIDGTRQARLLREAQSIARLSHPNVINVFDAGTHDGRVYIAMEYIEGQTLRQWVEATPHTWREKLAIFIEAARGLAAAHAAGLIHRDFKPENVLIDKSGRARVLDFGLARQAPARASGHMLQSQDTIIPQGRDFLEPELTRPGALAGTPAYMAPEQFIHGLADEQSDQYSFCVSLYEALYGRRPFEGGSLFELVNNATIKSHPPSIPRSTIPRSLGRTVLRGLTREPAQRFPSLNAMILELEKNLRSFTYKHLVIVILLVFLTISVFYTIHLQTTAQKGVRDSICSSLGADLHQIWDMPRQASVERALEQTRAPFAKDTRDRVLNQLNSYAAAWVQMRTDTCRATHVHGTQSTGLLDLRMACFQRRLTDFRALIDVFEHADKEIAAHAAEAAARLPDLSYCKDTTEFLEVSADSGTPGATTTSQGVREQLSRTLALRNTAQFKPSLEAATRAVNLTKELGDPSLSAEALFEQGQTLESMGNQVESRAAIRMAFFGAVEAGNDQLSANCALLLISQNLGLEAVQQWVPHAEALVARIVRRDGASARHLKAALLNAKATTAVMHEEYTLAEKLYNDSLAISDSSTAFGQMTCSGTHNNLGNLLLRRGEHRLAQKHIETSIDMYKAILGPHHPQIGIAMNNLGNVYHREGNFVAAEETFAQALVLFSETLGPGHPHVGVAHNNLGDTFKDTGRLHGAKDHYYSALNILTSAFGDNAGLLAYPLTGLGETLVLEGHEPSAAPVLERALALPDAGDIALRASLSFALARALVIEPSSRSRAMRLAEEGREGFIKAGPSYARELHEVKNWLLRAAG